MKNKEDIEKLITDLLDDSIAPGETLENGISYDSSKTVSAHARKKIGQLQIETIPVLKEMLMSQKDKDRRGEIYTLINHLADKYNKPDLIHFLIERLNHEKVKSFIGLKLSGISWSKQSLTEHSDIILDFAQNKNNHIRHSAILVLAGYSANLKEIEDFLIGILNNSSDEYDIYYSNITLQKIGTKRSIESLQKVVRENKKVDVLITGIYALGLIDGKSQVDFFLEMMQEKKDSFVKSALTEFISRHSDNRAIDTLIVRVKKILSRKRNINMHYGQDQYPEIVHALKYLTKFESEDSRISKLKTWILEKKMDYLDETEAIWVNKNIKSM
jgi:hypothetical protein